MNRLAGKVALISGGARGQGRAEAIRFAEEGADIVTFDACQDIDTIRYPGASVADLEETVRLVEKTGRRIFAQRADVRSYEQVKAVVDEGVDALGGLDIVVANAGVVNYGAVDQITEHEWDTVINIDLTGVWKTVKASVPHLKARGAGSIILISSGAGLVGYANLAHYTSAKHGLVGLMRSLANELGGNNIRANTIHPTQVDTPMIMNEATYAIFRPDLDQPDQESMREVSSTMNLLPVPWVEPDDIANAALFLASDEARYVTGLTMTVDAGICVKT